MVTMTAVVLAGAAGGCDDSCIEGVCPLYGESRSLPGPCHAASDNVMHDCTFRYTADRKLASVKCHDWNSFFEHLEEVNATWSYDDAGELASVTESGMAHSPRTWTWGTNDVVLAVSGSTFRRFDRATFAFLPGPWTNKRRPNAELGLLSSETAPATYYTWRGTATQRERTGSDGSHNTFTFDDAGHLLSMTGTGGDDAFTYDGDRIATETRGVTEEYRYDHGGNLVEVIGPEDREVYDYDCW